MPAQATHPMFSLRFLCIPGGHIFSWSLLASGSRLCRILSLTPVIGFILSALHLLKHGFRSFPRFPQKPKSHSIFNCSWLYWKFGVIESAFIVIAQNFEFWSFLYLKVCWLPNHTSHELNTIVFFIRLIPFV